LSGLEFLAPLCRLAAISGAVGLASAFSWVEPLRPYLILVTFFVLGFAWINELGGVLDIQTSYVQLVLRTFNCLRTLIGASHFNQQ